MSAGISTEFARAMLAARPTAEFVRATSALNTLRPLPGARKTARRVGRGTGCSKGKTCGRGHKGSQRSGNVMPGFEGGQTPLYRRLRKYGEFTNKMFKRTDYQVVNLGQLQNFIDRGRLDASKRITMRDLYQCGLIKKKKTGVKLLSEGKGWLEAKLDIEVSDVSAKALEAVRERGGQVTTVYFDKLGLRNHLSKDISEIHQRFAAAPPKFRSRFDLWRYPHPLNPAQDATTTNEVVQEEEEEEE